MIEIKNMTLITFPCTQVKVLNHENIFQLPKISVISLTTCTHTHTHVQMLKDAPDIHVHTVKIPNMSAE